MTDTITLTGIVGSDPRHHVTNQGLAITSFRFASRHRVLRPREGLLGGRRDQLVHRLRVPAARRQHEPLGAQGRAPRRSRSAPPARVGQRHEVRHIGRDRGRLDRTRPLVVRHDVRPTREGTRRRARHRGGEADDAVESSIGFDADGEAATRAAGPRPASVPQTPTRPSEPTATPTIARARCSPPRSGRLNRSRPATRARRLDCIDSARVAGTTGEENGGTTDRNGGIGRARRGHRGTHALGLFPALRPPVSPASPSPSVAAPRIGRPEVTAGARPASRPLGVREPPVLRLRERRGRRCRRFGGRPRLHRRPHRGRIRPRRDAGHRGPHDGRPAGRLRAVLGAPRRRVPRRAVRARLRRVPRRGAARPRHRRLPRGADATHRLVAIWLTTFTRWFAPARRSVTRSSSMT